ncbi:MAG: WD40/YVTN/BNR-like repeat-containing protein [Candidatus Dormibacteria bacterium]
MGEMARILVGTADGLHEIGDSLRRGQTWLAGRDVRAVAISAGELWAILDGHAIWHTQGSNRWAHVADLKGLQATCLAGTRAGVLVGTSEAHLYRMAPDGLEPMTSFDEAGGREDWFTPWGGPPDTRSISEDGEAAYVNVHVGGILRTEDGGRSWCPTLQIGNDVHRVLARPGHLYAACARGLAISPDRGGRWTFHDEGLHAAYCRAVAACGDSLLLSAAEGPSGRRTVLYRGTLDGDSLQPCGKGLPALLDGHIDSLCLDAVPGGELAAFGLADGSVYASLDQGASWDLVASGLPRIHSVLTLA